MARAAHLEVKLPPHVKPTDETNDQLIKKFLKECSKDSLLQFLFEKSAYSRRFTKKSILVREKKMRRLRNSKKYNEELNNDSIGRTKKKKPSSKTKQTSEIKQ
jgi:hypothetical protein